MSKGQNELIVEVKMAAGDVVSIRVYGAFIYEGWALSQDNYFFNQIIKCLN